MTLRLPARYRFPWRPGNRFRLLVDGERFFPAMLQAIEAAGHYVLLEMYLFESGALATRFIQALSAAARRGVAVRVLLDDFGALRLRRADRDLLQQAGVQLAYHNPLHWRRLHHNLFRDHRKLLLVDGQLAYVGGAGITDAFDPESQPDAWWHEVMVEVRGPVLADWQRLFVELWTSVTGAAPAVALRPCPPLRPGQWGRVAYTAPLRTMDIKRAALTRIRRARGRVWIASAYFVVSWKLRRALYRAARRGVDVRLLLPGRQTDHPAVRHASHRFYGRLLRNGVRIFEYQPRFMHAKVMLADDWVSAGSSNLDRWNLRWNLEANQEVEDSGFAAGVAAWFEQDLAQAGEVAYAQWQRRPWHYRLQEWLWGAVDVWLERLGRVKGRE